MMGALRIRVVPLRIAQVVTQLEAGGAQRLALLLTEELRLRGHEAETWFLYLKRPVAADQPGTRVLFPHRPTGADYLRIAARLGATIRAFRPDALLTHTHYANVMGGVVGRRHGVRRRVAVQHNPVGSYPRLAGVADRWLGAAGWYDANVCVSDAVAASFAGHPAPYRRRLVRIDNGIRLGAAGDRRPEARARWGFAVDRPLLLNVGRLAPQKNQAALLALAARVPEAQIAIVGEGELRPDLERAIAAQGLVGRVELLGERPAEEVAALALAADAFVFPSRWEGQSMALIEAAAAGLPVVASDLPTMREILGDAGRFAPPDDAEGFAAAVREILASPALAGELGAAARAAIRPFSIERVAAEYEAVLAGGGA